MRLTTWEEWKAQASPEAVAQIEDAMSQTIGAVFNLEDFLGTCNICGTLCDPDYGSDADVWSIDGYSAAFVCHARECQAQAESNGWLSPGSGA